jgi:hypothetical protein
LCCIIEIRSKHKRENKQHFTILKPKNKCTEHLDSILGKMKLAFRLKYMLWMSTKLSQINKYISGLYKLNWEPATGCTYIGQTGRRTFNIGLTSI